MVGTNTPGGGGFARLQVVHAIRVDLTDPDIRIFPTPRYSAYIAGSRETAGLKVMDFLTKYKVQVAINANFFDPSDYYLPAGTPMRVYGLLVSQGQVVSVQEGPDHSSSVIFGTNNQARIVFTNWPAISTAGISNAVSGEYPLVVAGSNMARIYLSSSDFIHQVNPRTAYGLSKDRHTLFLMTLDGRQPGYSDGSLDWETAEWMLKLGAYEAVNMDGGGSTTLVMADSVGNPIELNHSNAVADSGNERTVGGHFGIYAKPVPTFISDIAVAPTDTAATVSWTTAAPATTQLEYGLTTDLGSLTTPDPTPTTNHAVSLTGLAPATDYYFVAHSDAQNGDKYQSDIFVFTTTNYVTTNFVFDVTNAWSWTSTSLDGVPWTTKTYDDSAWNAPGPGLLWVDRRGPNGAIQPQGTQMAINPDTGFPYVTYYFRTHFGVTNTAPVFSLLFSAYIDDGAVFYLNGQEITRIEMADPPTQILNNTIAIGYFCAGGDATCANDFELRGDAVTNLVNGDNVMAVEVHNYSATSPDITFGTAFSYTVQIQTETSLSVTFANGTLNLSWPSTGFTLQQAGDPAGPWADVTGPVTTSPYSLSPSTGAQYYRLRR